MTSDGLRRTPLTDALRTVEELAAPLEREAVIDSIGRAAAESIGADLGFVGLLDGPDKLRLTGVHGGETDALESLRVERGRGLGGKVLAEGGADFVSDYAVADSITHDYDAPIAREGLAGVLCLPLVVSDDLIGVAYVSDRVPTSYSDVQLDRVLTAVESARLALTMADRSRQLTEAAIEVERERTAKALDASVGEHLGRPGHGEGLHGVGAAEARSPQPGRSGHDRCPRRPARRHLSARFRRLDSAPATRQFLPFLPSMGCRRREGACYVALIT